MGWELWCWRMFGVSNEISLQAPEVAVPVLVPAGQLQVNGWGTEELA